MITAAAKPPAPLANFNSHFHWFLWHLIERIVEFFKNAAKYAGQHKEILCLLGRVGGRQSSVAERLKRLFANEPIYVLKAGEEISTVFENPLGLFDPVTRGAEFENRYRIPTRRLTGEVTAWARKRLEEFGGDITKFTVVRTYPSRLKRIRFVKAEPAAADVLSLVGTIHLDLQQLVLAHSNEEE